jgi:hypothetical protein
MNEDLFGLDSGTPEIDEEYIEEAKQRLAAQDTTPTLQQTEQPTEQQQQTQTPEATAKPDEESGQKNEEERERELFYGRYPAFQEDDIDPNRLQLTAEAILTIPTSATDFVVDLLNLAPGVDLPKIPKFENDVYQSIRELSSVVLPTIGLTATGVGAGGAAANVASKYQKLKFLATDPLVKHLGTMAVGAGAGAFVDYTVEINQEDDNLTGVLKKNWPSWYGWIPDDIATLDTDTPDQKRAKNVTEGVYLGLGTDILQGGLKLLSKVSGFETKFIPKNEEAVRVVKEIEASDTVEEAVEESVGSRAKALDDLGKYNFDRAVELKGSAEEALKEPMLGVHDLYGREEIGTRSYDAGGISAAAIDSFRINNNIGTIDGRVGSVGTEAYIKRGLELNKDQATFFKQKAKELKAEVDFQYGKKVYTAKEIAENAAQGAADYYDMPLDEMKRMFELDIKERGVRVGELEMDTLSSEGMETARILTKQYINDLTSLDQVKAEALIAKSLSGQVSDTAQGMRMVEGTAAIERASEQIIDRLEYLMAMRGRASYTRGYMLNMTNLWKRPSDLFANIVGQGKNKKEYAKRVKQLLGQEKNKTLRSIEAIRLDAKNTADTLREIQKEKPEMLAPLLMAYEFTDGNVNSISKLNRFLKESTGTISKAIYDRNPEIPSVILQGFWSNVYNSTLSAFATPIKAGLSNMAGLVEKPLGAMIGSVRTGETQLMRRAWYQYSMNLEVLQDSFKYMAQVFKRSATEADVAGLARENMFAKNDDQIAILRAAADAQAKEGNFGPQVAMQQIEAMNDLAKHPWLRFGNRAMQALDGFTQTMIAHAEARGRAFDKFTDNGRLAFNASKADSVYKQTYKEMFDETGLIKDSAVRYTAGELSMSLDNATNDAVSQLIKRAPLLKPFFLFTKTPINDIKLMATYSPVGLFLKELQNFKLLPNQLTGDEIDRILTARQVDLTEMSDAAKYQKYSEIRADLYGRQAIGTLAVTGAVGLFMTDRLTGNGLYDKEKQKLRRDTDWKPRSIRLPGGQWISYDNLGPITNWLALVADIGDNMDVLAPNDIAENYRKLGFILSSSLTDKTFLAGLQPFLSIISGDVGELQRWSGSFITSATMPGSSLMAEMGRLMDPGLKEVEMSTFDVARNRIPFLKSQIPAKYDYIDGGEVGIPDNFMARVWNTYMPWKISGKISPEKEFLQMVEFDVRPTLRTNGRGVELTNKERSLVTKKMGEDKLFKEGIQRVMNSKDGKAFRESFRKFQKAGIEPDLKEFELVHRLLRRELRLAMNIAAAKLPNQDELQMKMLYSEVVGSYQQMGMLEEAKRFQEKMKEFSR